MVEHEFVPVVVELLRSKFPVVQEYAARVVAILLKNGMPCPLMIDVVVFFICNPLRMFISLLLFLCLSGCT